MRDYDIPCWSGPYAVTLSALSAGNIRRSCPRTEDRAILIPCYDHHSFYKHWQVCIIIITTLAFPSHKCCKDPSPLIQLVSLSRATYTSPISFLATCDAFTPEFNSWSDYMRANQRGRWAAAGRSKYSKTALSFGSYSTVIHSMSTKLAYCLL